MDSSRVDYDLMTLTDTIIKLNSKLRPHPPIIKLKSQMHPPLPSKLNAGLLI